MFNEQTWRTHWRALAGIVRPERAKNGLILTIYIYYTYAYTYFIIGRASACVRTYTIGYVYICIEIYTLKDIHILLCVFTCMCIRTHGTNDRPET